MELKSGIHYLSGVCEVFGMVDMYQEINGILITIDGKDYIAYHDAYDGYRSYGVFCDCDDNTNFNFVQKNKFPNQMVYIKFFDEDYIDIDTYTNVVKKGIIILNEDYEVILKVGTDYSEAYYPYSIFEYNPQNLPINKSKK